MPLPAFPAVTASASWRKRRPTSPSSRPTTTCSAHAPLAHYPDILKDEARRLGATAQVAGGVPAMCDGVTQGAPGMELSLFSRDAIAMGTAIALSTMCSMRR
jgi:dihydroxyacid dehydratase/phosphogluconate dehydratase